MREGVKNIMLKKNLLRHGKLFLLDNGIIVIFFVLLTGFAFFVPAFFSVANFFNVFRQITIYGTIALGVTYVVLCGKLDLSVGSMLSLLTVFLLDMINKTTPTIAILLTILVAFLCGAVNGFLVGYLKLNYFITTLAMLSILQGITLIYSGGKNIDIENQDVWFTVFGRGLIRGVPVPVIIFFTFAIILQLVLRFTVFGRKIYAVGGNVMAAYYSGIKSSRVILQCYLVSALTTAVAAIILGSRVMGTQNTVGENYELLVLSAIILGGTSLLGGSGSVSKTIFGVLILGFIENALLLLGSQYYVQWIVSCILIVMVAWFDIKTKQFT